MFSNEMSWTRSCYTSECESTMCRRWARVRHADLELRELHEVVDAALSHRTVRALQRGRGAHPLAVGSHHHGEETAALNAAKHALNFVRGCSLHGDLKVALQVGTVPLVLYLEFVEEYIQVLAVSVTQDFRSIQRPAGFNPIGQSSVHICRFPSKVADYLDGRRPVS